MWGSVLLQAGTSALANGASFIQASRKAKSDRAFQKYRNTMLRIADAQNQNTITTNQNMARSRSAMQEYAIRESGRLTKAGNEVAAAALGTEGRSVRQTLAQADRNVAAANSKRQEDLKAQFLGFAIERENSHMQVIQQTEYSPIPNPTGASQLLDFATDIGNIYQKTPGLKNKL